MAPVCNLLSVFVLSGGGGGRSRRHWSDVAVVADFLLFSRFHVASDGHLKGGNVLRLLYSARRSCEEALRE